MSQEALELSKQLAVLVGLPLVLWLAFLVADKARSLSTGKGEPHRLFGTVRLLFAVGGALLVAWGAFRSAGEPLDYTGLCVGLGGTLILYPLISNIRVLGVTWGLLSTFSQTVLVLVGGALGAFALSYGSTLEWPALATLEAYSSLVTWPVVALLGGIVFFPHLTRILGNVDSLEGFGGKISLHRQEQIDSVVSEQVEEEVDANDAVEEIRRLPRGVRAQERRYSNVISAWGVLSKLIAAIAAPYGGKSDLTKVRENLKLLREKGILDVALIERAERLFRERNGFKRRDAPISASEHLSYLDRAQHLAERLRPLNIKPSAPLVGGSGLEVRH